VQGQARNRVRAGIALTIIRSASRWASRCCTALGLAGLAASKTPTADVMAQAFRQVSGQLIALFVAVSLTHQ
jgi:hypothetical protein